MLTKSSTYTKLEKSAKDGTYNFWNPYLSYTTMVAQAFMTNSRLSIAHDVGDSITPDYRRPVPEVYSDIVQFCLAKEDLFQRLISSGTFSSNRSRLTS